MTDPQAILDAAVAQGDLPFAVGIVGGPDGPLWQGAAGEAALAHTVVVKLNGGLGTSMGMTRAKSLLVVKQGLTFLDVIARQMGELRERTNRTLTAIEHWLTVDDAMAREDYPDAQLLRERMRVASARWPLGGRLPQRVQELAQRVETYYESGDNPKRPVL